MRRLIVLGSTGSIGTQALEVVDHVNRLHKSGASPICFEVVGLAAGKNIRTLGEQSRRYAKAELAISHVDVRDLAIQEQGLGASFPGRLLGARHGPDAPERLVREVECDIVLGAMVGSAGLPATLAAIGRGRDVALANKETLVAAGELVVTAARKSGSRLLPVDSEHAGLWQCLGTEGAPPMTCGAQVRRATITASGGPFRTWDAGRLARATAEEALKHPTWRMGPKVTVDSASLMNKALEIIEAHWLFNLPGEKIGVVIHPQSTVHAMVEFEDGSLVAQMAAPDMRTPIQMALTWPRRVEGIGRRVDPTALGRLEFEPVDRARFPALDLAYEAIARGGTAGAILNAANEAAVRAFLDSGSSRPIAFGKIFELVRAAVAQVGHGALRSLGDIVEADRRAREFVDAELGLARGATA